MTDAVKGACCVAVTPPRFGESVTLMFEIVSVRLALFVCAVGVVESVTSKVSGLLITICVGVPVIAPVDAFRDKPVGSVPDGRDQVYGGFPPAAVSVAEYATFNWPFGKAVVVIVNGA